MKPEIVQLARRLVDECMKPAVRHYHPEVHQVLKEIQDLLAKAVQELPYYCLECHHVWVTDHHDEPCPQCEGVEILMVTNAEIQEEYTD